jgi:hypothetical protein
MNRALQCVVLWGISVIGFCVISSDVVAQEPNSEASAVSAKEQTRTQVVTRTQREAHIPFVWFSRSKNKGGVSYMTVRITPKPPGRVAVAMMEEFSNGTGDMWRASTWIAAFSATQALGLSLGDYEFLVKSGGLIDGPSASMMLTATMMALLRGDDLLPATVMTGAINPDGACGPVGGIIQKMEGASASGIKRFGYPIGARYQKDEKSGKLVDLEKLAVHLGLEVMVIRDFYDAYKFLTGVALSRPKPATESEMAFDVRQAERLKSRNIVMKAQVNKRVQDFEKRFGRASARGGKLEEFTIAREQLMADAQRFQDEGSFQAAGVMTMGAWAQIETASLLMSFVIAMAKPDEKRFDQFTPEPLLDVLQKNIQKLPARDTVGGWINMTYALRFYGLGKALSKQGYKELGELAALVRKLESEEAKPSEEVLVQFVEKLFLPIAYFSLAKVSAYAGILELDVGAEQGKKRPSKEALTRFAVAYRAAASANLDYFDSLILTPLAAEAKMSREEGEAFFASHEQSYLVANALTQYSMSEGDLSGEANTMLALAAAVDAYTLSSALIYKYYSLRAKRNKDGKLEFENRRGLLSHLDLARQRALEAAGACSRNLGFIPEATKIEYSYALAMRDGDDEDKLEALQGFWLAAFWSKLAIAIAE